MNNNLDYIAQYVINLIKKDKNVYILIVDGWECYLFNEAKKHMSKEECSRIINTGISEQNTVGVASGIALTGKTVYLFMFAAFLCHRANEQLLLDIGYNNANVKIIGIHGGITGPCIAGYSHYCTDDLAIINAIPNIKIYVPNVCSDSEIKNISDVTYKIKGPCYIRLDRPGQPWNNIKYPVKSSGLSAVFNASHPDVIIIATGAMVLEAVELCKNLSSIGYQIMLYSAHTIKPFDSKTLIKIIDKNIPIISMEEHVKYGGLASIILDVIVKCRKNIKYFPIYITNYNYARVFLNYKTMLEYYTNISDIQLKISEFINHKNSIICVYSCINNRSQVCTYYKVLNKVIILVKQTKKHRKIYLLGKIRIK